MPLQALFTSGHTSPVMDETGVKRIQDDGTADRSQFSEDLDIAACTTGVECKQWP